jgi:hypothetical protein
MASEEPDELSKNPFLGVLLAVLLGGGIFTYLVVITGGFFLYVLLAGLGLWFFGYLHYLLWGRSLSQRVADEPSEDNPPNEDMAGEWPDDGPSGPHRL